MPRSRCAQAGRETALMKSRIRSLRLCKRLQLRRRGSLHHAGKRTTTRCCVSPRHLLPATRWRKRSSRTPGSAHYVASTASKAGPRWRSWLLAILVNRARTTGAREARTVPTADPEPAVDRARFTSAGAWSNTAGTVDRGCGGSDRRQRPRRVDFRDTATDAVSSAGSGHAARRGRA